MVEPMMTARQVAQVLGVHENWVYDQAVGGDLPSYTIGGARRFLPEEIRNWIAEHREAQRERHARKRTARMASALATAQGRRARVEEVKPEPGRSQPPGKSGRGGAPEGRGEPQPRLFDA